VIVREIEDPPAPLEALAGLGRGAMPFVLLSAARDPRFGRYSFAGADPFRAITTRGEDPFPEIRRLLEENRLDPDVAGDSPSPLPAGMVGFLSYDLGRTIERLPEIAKDDLRLPDLCLGLYDAVVTWDHETGRTWLTSTGLPLRGPAGEERARAQADRLEALLRSGAPEAAPADPSAAELASTFDRAGFEAAVARAKELIAAGDLFQVNLSQRFSAATRERGPAILSRLCEVNPAPFAAYVASSCGAEIVSASPERFLRVSGSGVETCPIKGTRPRDADPAEDERLARELLSSAKDRAELVMIVDLMRNDLGRVAEFGSVEVTELPALTSHPTVHHLHGTVVARLAEGRDVVDLLRSAFPGGSITGAPKVRAMEIIEETEPFRRGVYTGSIGYLSFSGEADLSVAIRTLCVKDGRASYSVGAGIVADSDPSSEYEETLHKGRGLAACLGIAP
jgi:para-aminobenzoate synthetase component 1